MAALKKTSRYWAVVKPYWNKINIYDGPEEFLRTFAAAPRVPGLLYAAHFCQSEVCNGGFEQFFWNSTGVLGPEALQGFRAIGMPATADVLRQALNLLGQPYPRDRQERVERLEEVDPGALDRLDQSFFQLIASETGGFDKAADAFATVAYN